jgi:peptidyl-prolyl cis-trans isomerase C
MSAPVVLSVAGQVIGEADIAREMQFHRAREPQQSRADAARALVVRELLRRELEARGLEQAVQPQGRETAEEAAVRVLVDEASDVAAPSQDDCRRWFEQNRARLREPDRISARHILFAAPPDDAEARLAAREQAEALIAELTTHPERFTEFAMRHSDCPSKEQGGELGWLMRGQTTPEFDRQLFMLKQGLAGLSVESRYGHHVVMIDAIERGGEQSFERALPRITEYLELQRRQNAIRDFLLELAERHRVEGLDEIEQAA